MSYATIKVRTQATICFIQFNRPEANNTIDAQLLTELEGILAECEDSATVIVLSGSPEVFCLGADLGGPERELAPAPRQAPRDEAGALYDLWLKLATGPYITVSHVQGKANAGGVGFVAASDLVLADERAQFSLSELLFGLLPACVLPFLVRRVGFQRAQCLALTTQTISARTACEWGLADACEAQSEALLRRHLLRLSRLSKTTIRRYKRYASTLAAPLAASRSAALAAHREVFGDPQNLQAIERYLKSGLFPWEKP